MTVECPGVETSPNECRCPCEGCKYHCSAHVPPRPTTPAELEAWKERFTQDLVGRPYDEWSQTPVHPGGAEQPWQN